MSALVVASLLTGMALASTPHPSTPATSTGQAVSLSSALAASDAVAATVAPGNWTAVGAVGFAPHEALSVPGPVVFPPPYAWCMTANGSAGGTTPSDLEPRCVANATNGSNATPMPIFVPCPWSPLSGTNLTWNGSLVAPAMTTSVGSGLATLWLVTYVGAPNTTLLVTVLNGTASPFAIGSGPFCTVPGVEYGSLHDGVIDSTQAARVVNAWGGAAFLANVTDASAVYTVSASLTYRYETTVCNATWGMGGPVGYNGTCQNSTFTYVQPATWQVLYTSFGYGSVSGPASGTLFAYLNGTTGVPVSISIYLGGWGWCLGGMAKGTVVCPMATVRGSTAISA